MKKVKVYDRVVFIPDIHAPYVHGDAFRAMIGFLGVFKPQTVFILGDVIDFYQLSRFNKNPARLPDLQTDIDAASLCLQQIRRAAPTAKMFFIKGNHEERFTKFLWSRAAEFVSLRDFTVPHLLRVSDFDIEYVEKGSMMFHGLLVKHGNIVRTRSGYTATGELEKAWVSGVSGHTHRLSQVFKTNFAGTFTWMECGCLCKLDPEYAEGQVTDWQHGLGYGFFEKGGNSFEIHTLPIIHGRIRFGGEVIDPKSARR